MLLALAGLSLILVLAPSPAHAETVRRDGMVVSFDGQLSPRVLPRDRALPINTRLSGRVRSESGRELPKLKRILIEVNRHAVVDTQGMPVCEAGRITHLFAPEALGECRRSLVGRGRFGVQVAFPDQAVTRTHGKVLAFYSWHRGRPAVLIHVVTLQPVPVVITLPLIMRKRRGGEYGFVLSSPPLSRYTGPSIFTTDFDFRLGRRYRAAGKDRSFISAACPAPAGFPSAAFSLARATYTFEDGRRFRETLNRTCRVARK